VDQNRAAELIRRVNETLVPKLEKLSGFAAYWLIEVVGWAVAPVRPRSPAGRASLGATRERSERWG
jgi:hypothetical protein